MSKTKREWFESRKAVYFMLLIFFPVGLYGLWKNESFQHPSKILITAIIGLIVIINAFIEPLPPPPSTPVTRANPQAAVQGEQGRVLIDLAGNNPPRPAGPADKKVSQIGFVADFQKRLSEIEAPAQSAIDVATKKLEKAGSNRAALFSTYSSICSARDACYNTWSDIGELQVPTGVSRDVEKSLEEAKISIQIAYLLRRDAYAALVDFLDEGKPKYLQTFKKNADASQVNVLRAGMMLATATKQANQ